MNYEWNEITHHELVKFWCNFINTLFHIITNIWILHNLLFGQFESFHWTKKQKCLSCLAAIWRQQTLCETFKMETPYKTESCIIQTIWLRVNDLSMCMCAEINAINVLKMYCCRHSFHIKKKYDFQPNRGHTKLSFMNFMLGISIKLICNNEHDSCCTSFPIITLKPSTYNFE